ncbi:hypothetical protein [Streptomyces sp. NPDC020917]|uniref:hypothetical protein n=1 Tax=Streptomyces sp. NPDC020917 TaxID=3365102 RepID=UPI0037A95067
MTDAHLNVLLAAADPGDEQRIRARLGLPAPGGGAVPPTVWTGGRWMSSGDVPASVVLWMLERDRPEVNEIVFFSALADRAIRRDIQRGLPFGDRAAGSVPVAKRVRTAAASDLRDVGAAEAVSELRQVTSMKTGRSAAALVQREHWDSVDAADRERPLPGYARWALAIRIDCPKEVRERLGAGHPSFAHRMRQAGIVDDPDVYVRGWGPARQVLSVLDAGRWAFPERVAQALDGLRPLVRERLGGSTEAWAVAAQLLPTFTGTVPELVATAGAIA